MTASLQSLHLRVKCAEQFLWTNNITESGYLDMDPRCINLTERRQLRLGYTPITCPWDVFCKSDTFQAQRLYVWIEPLPTRNDRIKVTIQFGMLYEFRVSNFYPGQVLFEFPFENVVDQVSAQLAGIELRSDRN